MNEFINKIKGNILFIKILSFVFIFIGIYYIYKNVNNDSFINLIYFVNYKSTEEFFIGLSSTINVLIMSLLICSGFLLLFKKNIGWYISLVLLLSISLGDLIRLTKAISIFKNAFSMGGLSFLISFIAIPLFKIIIATIVFLFLNTSNIKKLCNIDNKYFNCKYTITILIGIILGSINIINYIYEMFLLTGKLTN